MSIGDQTTRKKLPEPEQVLDQSELLEIQSVVSELHTPEPTFDFAARLVLATHPDREEASSRSGWVARTSRAAKSKVGSGVCSSETTD